jgi:hypothetical protein
MTKILEYYFVISKAIVHIIFAKYTIDKCGVIKNEKGEALSYRIKSGYQSVGVQDASGKRRRIQIGRALASTFLGPPPSPAHTADHIDQTRVNDVLENIQWATKTEQAINRTISDTNKSAFLIVRDGEEKTFIEWVKYFNSKNKKNPYGREYTKGMINHYAQNKQHGFSYKEYPNLKGEVWKDVEGSKNTRGDCWQVSNMNRVKWITNHAENVIEGDSLGLTDGYPTISFGKKIWLCHIVAFMTFFPDEWAAKKTYEMILHKEDNKLDFRPEMLRLGTGTENNTDAHDNGKYDGTLRERQKCVSYINGVFEKSYESQESAAAYLRSNGYLKARHGSIRKVLNGDRKTAYGRTWVRI